MNEAEDSLWVDAAACAERTGYLGPTETQHALAALTPRTGDACYAILAGHALRSALPSRITARRVQDGQESAVDVCGGSQVPEAWLTAWLHARSPGVPINALVHGDPEGPAPTCIMCLQSALCPCGAVVYTWEPGEEQRLLEHLAALAGTDATPVAVYHRHRARPRLMRRRTVRHTPEAVEPLGTEEEDAYGT